MEQVKFTNMDDVRKLQEDFMYLANVHNEAHGCEDFEFLLYKNNELLIWDSEDSEYIELDDHLSVINLANLGKRGLPSLT